jgi:putative membrane protein
MTSYCGAAPSPAEWISRWNFDPVLLLGLVLCAALALRAQHPRLALGGVALLAVAFVSPLCALSVALFSARAVHHILIVAVAAPLFALAFPSRRIHGLGLPLLVATATLWLWHVPSLYDRALTDSATYWIMQVSLLATALWLWRALFSAPAVPATLAAIFAMVQMGMLGALLTFAAQPLYQAHAGTTLPWGMDQLADQQLAGLIMWAPGMIPYAIIAALIGRRLWLRAELTS